MNEHTRDSTNGSAAGPSLDPALAALDAALADLARKDAASAPAGFEDRVALATMPGRAEAILTAEEGTADVVYSFRSRASRDAWIRPLRLAAMIAVAASAGLMWFAWSRPTVPIRPEIASVEQDVNTWLGITDTDAAFARSELDELAIDTESLDRSLGAEPAAGAWFLEGEPL